MLGDVLDEADETATVQLGKYRRDRESRFGGVTIADDDAAPEVSVQAAVVSRKGEG